MRGTKRTDCGNLNYRDSLIEYETIASLGSLCGIGDLKVVAKANQLVGQYVLDSISTGTTIAGRD